MVTGLARFAVRRRRLVLVATLLFVALSIGFGTGVVKRLSGGGFNDPRSQSSRAERALATQFHTGMPNFTLLVKADANVDSPAVARAGEALTRRLSDQPGVGNVISYWTAGHPQTLRSTNGNEALILVRLLGSDDKTTHRGHDLAKAFGG